MLENRLNGLALMYIHRDIDVNVEECIDAYARKYPRKMKFRLDAQPS